jgi:hypothetical protein
MPAERPTLTIVAAWPDYADNCTYAMGSNGQLYKMPNIVSAALRWETVGAPVPNSEADHDRT